MTATESFDVLFHTGGSRPRNPFRFSGAGRIVIEPDFVTLDGTARRSFQAGRPASERIRMVDIVNVWSDGERVQFDQQRVDGDRSIGFTVSTPEQALRIIGSLPQRRTEAFATAQADAETFQRQMQDRGSTPVMWSLLVANVAIFVLMMQENVPDNPLAHSQQLIRWGSNAGRYTLGGEWWRLVTSMFLHGGMLHIAFNMIVLFQVGGLVERLFGSLRFALLYLIAGVCGSLASVLWNPFVNSVGASGAIFGIIGGLLAFVRNPDNGVPATIAKNLRGSITGFLLFNVAAGLIYPYTDNAAHFGGLAGGYIAGLLLARSLEQR
ncbi:MAG TPA: rhomboid family intramembrane serine protease [Telluria sp.]